jgi:hypothetical protein
MIATGFWRGVLLLHVLRKRMDYPDLRRAVKQAAQEYKPPNILIEDEASETQLIQDLKADMEMVEHFNREFQHGQITRRGDAGAIIFQIPLGQSGASRRSCSPRPAVPLSPHARRRIFPAR